MGKKSRWLLWLFLLLLLAGLFLPRWLTQEMGNRPSGKGSASLGLVLLDQTSGVYVLAVSERSPAWHAGILPGDSIVAAEGCKGLNQEDLDALLGMHAPEVTLTILRNGKTIPIILPIN